MQGRSDDRSHVVELALRALSTPLVDAPEALEVLADALLEAGDLDGRGYAFVPPHGYASFAYPDEPGGRARAALLADAVHWARDRLVVQLLDGCWMCRTPSYSNELICSGCGWDAARGSWESFESRIQAALRREFVAADANRRPAPKRRKRR